MKILELLEQNIRIVSEVILSLPMNSYLTDSEINFIVKEV